MTTIECFLGCPACKTALYRVDREERAPGTFSHALVALTDPAADRWKCGDCGGDLARVEGPKG